MDSCFIVAKNYGYTVVYNWLQITMHIWLSGDVSLRFLAGIIYVLFISLQL